MRELVSAVEAGDQAAVEAAISWLRLDPFCLWSGYAKQVLMRRLARTKLSTRQAQHLREVLLAIIPKGRREEFRECCRLARAVQNDGFRARLRELLDHQDEDTAQRARWMLDGCLRVPA